MAFEFAGAHIAIGSILSGCYSIVKGITQLRQSYKFMPLTLTNIALTCNATTSTLKVVDSILNAKSGTIGDSYQALLDQFDGLKTACFLILSVLEQYVSDLLDGANSDIPLKAQKTSRRKKWEALYNESEMTQLFGLLQNYNNLLTNLLSCLENDKLDKLVDMTTNSEKTLETMYHAQESHRRYLETVSSTYEDDTASIRTWTTNTTNLTVFDFDSIIQNTAVYRRCMRRRGHDASSSPLEGMMGRPSQNSDLENSVTEQERGPAIEPRHTEKVTEEAAKPREDGEKTFKASGRSLHGRKSTNTAVDSPDLDPEHSIDLSDFDHVMRLPSHPKEPVNISNHSIRDSPNPYRRDKATKDRHRPSAKKTSSRRRDDASREYSPSRSDRRNRSERSTKKVVAAIPEMNRRRLSHEKQPQVYPKFSKAHSRDSVAPASESSNATQIQRPRAPRDTSDSPSHVPQRVPTPVTKMLYDQHEGVYAMAVSSKFILATASLRFIRLWNLPTGKKVLQIPIRSISSLDVTDYLAFSSDGSSLAAIYSTEYSPEKFSLTIGVWESETGATLSTLQINEKREGGRSGRDPRIAFSAGNELIACCQIDRRSLEHDSNIQSVGQCTVMLYDTAKGWAIGQFPQFQELAEMISFIREDRQLLVCFKSRIEIWDVATCTFVQAWEYTGLEFLGCIVTHDCMLAYHDCDSIGLIDLKSGAKKCSVEIAWAVHRFAFSPGSQKIAFVGIGAGHSGSAGIYDPWTGSVEELCGDEGQELPTSPFQIAMSPDGQTVFYSGCAFADAAGEVWSWDVRGP